MFESIFSLDSSETSIAIESLLMSLGVSLMLGFIISFVYMKTHKTKTPSQSFSLALVFLPIIVTFIILMVGNSVARAFSLAGAFAIIRFRSTPGDPRDITFVLFTMAIGLACGMGYLAYGAIVAIILCFVMIILEALGYGRTRTTQKLLKITVPENLDYQNAFEGVLNRYTTSYKLIKVKTADLGSLYDLQYMITCKEDTNERSFIDDLRCRNGNLNITLVMDAPQNDYKREF